MMAPRGVMDSVLIVLLAVTISLVAPGVTGARPLQASSSSAEAAIRDMSIETINDYQRDFFLEAELLEGGLMTLDGNLHDPIPRRMFLTEAAAAKVPALALSNLQELLRVFNVPSDTTMAQMIGTSAYLCGNSPLPGEARSCPTSLQGMGTFVSSRLGENVELLATSGAPATSAPAAVKAPVKILDVQKGSLAQGRSIVVCHNIWLPSQAYYCHQVTGTKVVTASLQAANGSVIQAVGVCHLDTSLWSSSHPAFAALHIPRGNAACHWTVQNDLIWVPAGTDARAADPAHILPATVQV